MDTANKETLLMEITDSEVPLSETMLTHTEMVFQEDTQDNNQITWDSRIHTVRTHTDRIHMDRTLTEIMETTREVTTHMEDINLRIGSI